MANIHNLAGTSELSFKIGLGGFAIYQGDADPTVTPPTPNAFGFGDGDLYIRTAAGSISIYAYDTGAWVLISGGAAVTSYNGRTGAVLPTASDYDADQIDYDDTATSLPGAPTNVQAAIEALDGLLSGGPWLPLAGGTMLGDIIMDTGWQHLADGSAGATNPAYAFDTDDASGMYSPAVNEIGFATSSGARMRIDSSGRIIAETASYETLVDSDQVLANKKYVDEKPIPYDLAFYIGGSMSAPDDIVGGMIATRAVRLATNVPGSQAYALTATHASAVSYTVEVNGVSIGTVDFPATTAVGTFTITATDLVAGDRITMKTPNPAVSGIEDVMITIVGCAATANCTPP